MQDTIQLDLICMQFLIPFELILISYQMLESSGWFVLMNVLKVISVFLIGCSLEKGKCPVRLNRSHAPTMTTTRQFDQSWFPHLDSAQKICYQFLNVEIQFKEKLWFTYQIRWLGNITIKFLIRRRWVQLFDAHFRYFTNYLR